MIQTLNVKNPPAALAKGGFLLGPRLHNPAAEGSFKTQALFCDPALEMQGKQRVLSLPARTENSVVGLWLGAWGEGCGDNVCSTESRKSHVLWRPCLAGPSVSLESIFGFIAESDCHEAAMGCTRRPTGTLGTLSSPCSCMDCSGPPDSS